MAINSQLSFFRNGSSLYYNNSFIITNKSVSESITEVLTSPEVLSIAIVIAIASLLFGAYKLAIYLGYFSSKNFNENKFIVPTAPPMEEEPIVFQFISPRAPSIEQVFSESHPVMQERLFNRYYPSFGEA